MKIFPVIHYLDAGLALDQLDLAKEEGADGAFLISHDGRDDEMIGVALQAKRGLGDFALGINLLSKKPWFACEVAKQFDLDMVWADRMGVDSSGLDSSGLALSGFAEIHPRIQLFASVAFKYQAIEKDPALAAQNAWKAGFIPTTSGNATGVAPHLSKIADMSVACQGSLAVASGITPENAIHYRDLVSCALVSTGISSDGYRLNRQKLRALLVVARSHEPALAPI